MMLTPDGYMIWAIISTFAVFEWLQMIWRWMYEAHRLGVEYKRKYK